MKTDKWPADLKVSKKISSPASILRDHRIAAFEGLDGPKGQVTEVSDRSGNQGERRKGSLS
jgi:hypothetical protein